ncbi:glutathione peroxidase [Natribacillus halophilus]|uniref:Glutathione peroxidase n=1 Tax=Natribacillus halophilus TaxID=549003 RepID=A0A1G8L0G5_9BACI|nr:glutathione peroxidase [Natribacillus halophilus]SDI49091.1 glutathione peroxidase [Natribacillus halophilus]
MSSDSGLFRMNVKKANGEEISLGDYQGNVLLIVNVASECGFTPQYEQLEDIYEEYRDRGFEVLAFPSNDFGGQEPGSNEDIAAFCEENYGVEFEVFDKVHARGQAQHPLYQWLLDKSNPGGQIDWNFEKFIISRNGEILGSFKSATRPDDPQIKQMIERGLEQE